MNKKIYYIDRRTGEKREEKVYFERVLRFLYGNAFGRLLAMLLANLPFFSHIFGWWQRSSFTKSKILPFIQKYEIDVSEFEMPIPSYSSFDAFFTRKLKREARPLADGLIAPADGRYLFYQNIETCDGFVVKGQKFSLEKLTGSPSVAVQYANGSMVIARLCPSDYHRFHFPCDCTPSVPRLINGTLYSVNPIALKQRIELLTENKRMVTKLTTENYGELLFIEIGATNVGSIHQTFTPNQPSRKGEEKGYFSFGGSSIILLFETNRIQFAEDLLTNSSEHIETLCLVGQPLESKI